MKRFLIAAFALSLAAATESAASVAQSKVSATSVNSKVAFSGIPPVEVIVFNDGADSAYVDFSGVAVAANGSSVLLTPCQGIKAMFSHDGPASVGVITASGKTATVRVTGYSGKDYGGPTAPMSRDTIEFFGSSAGCAASMNGGNIVADSISVTGVVGGQTVVANDSVSANGDVSGGTVTITGDTASRLAVIGAGKTVDSNGAITTDAIPKSAASGSSLVPSGLIESGGVLHSLERFRYDGPLGETASCGWGEETLTLVTNGTTTDTSANLLPANSLIVAVAGTVSTTITADCTGWELGDATTVARFTSNNVTLAAGTASVGLKAIAGGISTDATGPTQASAAKVRVTCAGGNPGAGAIKIAVFSCSLTAPTNGE